MLQKYTFSFLGGEINFVVFSLYFFVTYNYLPINQTSLGESLFISLLVAQTSSFLIRSLPLTQLVKLTVLGEGSKLKNWMLEQPVKK